MWIKHAQQKDSGMVSVSKNEAFSHLVYNETEARIVAKVIFSFNTF